MFTVYTGENCLDNLVGFDSYSFYQDNIGKLLAYVEELEESINKIAYTLFICIG